MPDLPAIRDGAPIFGMDSVSDKKDLKRGQCVSLINARPGNPPDPRVGCEHHVIANTVDYEYASNELVHISVAGTTYIIFWVEDGADYHLVKVDYTTKVLTIIATAAGLTDPHFSLIKAHDLIYAITDQDMSIVGNQYLDRHLIIEPFETDDVVRAMCFDVSPEIDSVSLDSGGAWSENSLNWLEYAFTYVRRTDDAAFDSTGHPIEITTFQPGILEGIETLANRVTLELSGSNKKIIINALTAISTGYRARGQGASHIRVYRTRRSSTEETAQGATKIFCKDIPAYMRSVAIENVVLSKHPVRITTNAAHGFTTGDTVKIINMLYGTTELNDQDYTITKIDADTFDLDGTDPTDFSQQVLPADQAGWDGGGAIKSPVDITAISIPENTITIETQTAHGGTANNRILMTGIVGPTELNGVIFDKKSWDSATEFTLANPGDNLSAYVSGGTFYRIEANKNWVMKVDISDTYVKLYIYRGIGTSYYGPARMFANGERLALESFGAATELNGTVATVTGGGVGSTMAFRGSTYQTYQYREIVETDVLSSGISTPASGDNLFQVIGYGSMVLDDALVADITFSSNQIEITTDGAHGFADAESVYLADIVGTTSLNGAEYVITYVDTDKFKLPYQHTAGAAAYVSGGYCSNDSGGIVSNIDLAYPVVTVTDHGLEDDDNIGIVDVGGSTELNGNSYAVLVIDDDSFYLLAVDSNDLTDYTSGGSMYVGGVQIEDAVTDDALAGETATMVMQDYMEAPKAAFVEFSNNRMWLFGLLEYDKGRVYASEYPGGESGTPLDVALSNPIKFVSMFKPAYHFDFSIKRSQYATGIKRLGGDTYFFFDEETFALYGSDLNYSDAQLASDHIGCAFPKTLTLCSIELPRFGGPCILFLSNKGPACINQGGEIFLLTDLAIAELWPEESTELYGDLADNREWIINNCTAEYWSNTWFIAYETSSGVSRVWAYYLNPALRNDDNAPRGPYEIEMVEV